MRIAGKYQDIPGYWIDDAVSPDGRRWTATKYGWDRVRALVCRLAQERCEDCTSYTPLSAGDADHEGGRGLGGSRRDDRLYIGEKRNLWWKCRPCHRIKKHGQGCVRSVTDATSLHSET